MSSEYYFYKHIPLQKKAPLRVLNTPDNNTKPRVAFC